MIHKLTFLLLSIVLLVACASKKTLVKVDKTKIVRSTIIEKDSIYKEVKTLPIKDSVFISLKTNSKIVDSIVRLKLQHFYTTKTSGANSYSASFDTLKKGLKIITSIKGASDIQTNSTKKTAKSNQVLILKKETAKTVKSVGIGWRWFLFFLCLVIAVIFFVRFKLL